MATREVGPAGVALSDGRLSDDTPERVDAAEAHRERGVAQLLGRPREALGEIPLLSNIGLAMRAPCTGRADDERAERDERQAQVADDLAARRANTAFLPVGQGEKPRRREGRRDDTSGNQEKQDRKQHGLSGHGVNLSENLPRLRLETPNGHGSRRRGPTGVLAQRGYLDVLKRRVPLYRLSDLGCEGLHNSRQGEGN